MGGKVVLGIQWGDEGKGKIVEAFAQKSDMVVRFQGGNNAGHTIYINDQKFVSHLIPSGITNPDIICIIGSEVVLDLDVLFGEISELEKRGFSHIFNKLLLSGRANVIMPYHKALDRCRELNKGEFKIGTTGRGIGPAYEDLVCRRGIRLIDILNLDSPEVKQRLHSAIDEKNAIIKYYCNNADDASTISLDEVYSYLNKYRKELDQLVTINESELVNDYLARDKEVLFEGAQGTLLDYIHGTFPYVTSSHTVSAAVCTSLGVAPQKLEKIYGIMKAYTTRVGEGPFPTELNGKVAEILRSRGGEFGATTGRPRRCGWLDLPGIRWACMVNGITDLIITKVDVLAGLDNVRVNNYYQIPGNDSKYTMFNPMRADLYRPTNTIEVTSWIDYDSPEAKEFYRMIEAETGVPVSGVSYGPGRDELQLSL